MPQIILEVEGKPYTNFLSANVSRSMETLSGTFEFIATIDNFNNFPIKLQDPVRVLIDDIPILTGFVEMVEPSYTNNSHQIRLAGRDKTADVVDSSALSNVNYTPNITLKTIIQRLLIGNNITDIKVIDNAQPAIFKEGDIISGEDEQTLFEIIDKYCAKRQVLATSDGNGDIVIIRGADEELPGALIHKNINLLNFLSGRQNNILSASATYNMQDRFHAYIVRSQMNLSALNATSAKRSAEEIVLQEGGSIDNDVRRTRDFILSADTSNNSQTATERATWEANVRRTRSFNYNCTVQGFFANEPKKILWEPNKLIQVEDEKADVSGQLLIKSVNYSFSEEGSLTSMECGYKDSFTLEANQKAIEASSNAFGLNI